MVWFIVGLILGQITYYVLADWTAARRQRRISRMVKEETIAFEEWKKERNARTTGDRPS